MENRKNTILLTVIAVATLLVAVVGATFAYFTAQGTGSKQKDVTVTTETIDSMAFWIQQDITINVPVGDFGVGKPDKEGSTTATATFKANNADASEFCYTVKLNVTTNTFAYTAENTSRLPELTLHVTKKSAGEGEYEDMIAIPTREGDPGDITTKTGTISIPTSAGATDYVHKISAAAGQSVTDNWNVTVTFVNHDFDQSSLGEEGTGNVNTGKAFNATLIFESTACA